MEELRGLQRHLRSFDGMKVLEDIKHVYIVRVIIHLFIFINSRRQRRQRIEEVELANVGL